MVRFLKNSRLTISTIEMRRGMSVVTFLVDPSWRGGGFFFLVVVVVEVVVVVVGSASAFCVVLLSGSLRSFFLSGGRRYPYGNVWKTRGVSRLSCV